MSRLRLGDYAFTTLRQGRQIEKEPLALEPGATVADVAAQIHNDLGAACRNARIWGPSARFAGQMVGRNHPLQDGDIVEIIV
ncbi:MAG: TGS domain-containing protein [Ktedonobacteraceae bacterium]|nr:TGS domain-containing protein [Ktedonobacteraceae bacterium]